MSFGSTGPAISTPQALTMFPKRHTTTGCESAVSQPTTVTLLERLCASVDSACIVRRLRKEGCTVGLDGSHDRRLILDLDRPRPRRSVPRRNPLRLPGVHTTTGRKDGGVVALEMKNGPAPNARRRPATSRGEACRPPTPCLGDCGLENPSLPIEACPRKSPRSCADGQYSSAIPKTTLPESSAARPWPMRPARERRSRLPPSRR